jgi:O-antigen/teichoic acid export membrane protein
LSDFGINDFITQNHSTSKEEQRNLFSNAFSFKLILLIVYPVFMMMVGWVLGYTRQDIYLLGILSFIQSLLQFISFFRANFQASQFFGVDSFASIADKIILIAVILILMKNKLSLEGFIYGRLIAITIAFFILYMVLLKFYGWIRPDFHPGWIKKIITYSWPFALIHMMYAINEKVDQVMIERMVGAEEAGLYAGAYRWLDAFMMYIWIIMPIFFAKFAFHKGDRLENEKIFQSGQIIVALPLIFVACFGFFYGDKLFFQFTNSSTEQLNIMTITLKILFASMLLHSFFSIYSTLMNSTGYVKTMSIVIVSSIVINVVLNLIFIPSYGAQAAALATVASTLFVSLSAFTLVMVKKSITVPFELLFKLFLVLMLTMACFYFLPLLKLDWYVVSLATGFFMLIACYFLGFKRYLF